MQALACERAAMHYRRNGENEKALDYFIKAESCYTKWGSDVKASQMNSEIRSLKSSRGNRGQIIP